MNCRYVHGFLLLIVYNFMYWNDLTIHIFNIFKKLPFFFLDNCSMESNGLSK